MASKGKAIRGADGQKSRELFDSRGSGFVDFVRSIVGIFGVFFVAGLKGGNSLVVCGCFAFFKDVHLYKNIIASNFLVGNYRETI
jgi:hypothetical protein